MSFANTLSRLLKNGFLGPNQLGDLHGPDIHSVVACTPMQTADIETSVCANKIYNWAQLPLSNPVEVTNSDRIGALTATELTSKQVSQQVSGPIECWLYSM